MGLLSDIRDFLKKYLKNPFVVAGAAYLIYKILSKSTGNTESLEENIRVVHTDGDNKVVFDTETNAFAIVNGTDIIPAKSLADAKSKISRNNKLSKTSKEKLDKLAESLKVN